MIISLSTGSDYAVLGEWDIELDLKQQQPGITTGDLIATGTITAPGYGQSPRERAAFIVTTIRKHLRHTQAAEAARTDYAPSAVLVEQGDGLRPPRAPGLVVTNRRAVSS